MGKRRGRKLLANRGVEDDGFGGSSVSTELLFDHKSSLSKRLRRQRRKNLKKVTKINFEAACDEVLCSRAQIPTESDPKSIPPPIAQSFPDTATLALLSSFINSYLDAFENGPPYVRLASLYASDATLTFQVLPFFCRSEQPKSTGKKSKFKVGRFWTNYERFSCSLLPGDYPLPGWAWAHMSRLASSKLNRLESLTKSERQEVKALKAFQEGHVQRVERIRRSASSMSDRFVDSIPPPPLSREPARGCAQVLGLLSRLPRMVHIRDDECCRLDVVSSEPTAIFVRYACLAAELVSPDVDSEELSCMSDQSVEITGVGTCLVYGVHRSLIIIPNCGGQILQEDLSIFPATRSLIEANLASIKRTVSARFFEGERTVKFGDGYVCSQQPEEVVKEFSRLTGMNRNYSTQCLTECGFDLKSALVAFKNAFDSGLLPPSAFGTETV
ncbi:unnamed protein product [Calicophoron daubneyi]|uniref:TAP-C domain-containing protein n=1 Tax=Calicophoron daubneyi TaxID=300641 RepID=A0AAV2TDZ4_CALDB